MLRIAQNEVTVVYLYSVNLFVQFVKTGSFWYSNYFFYEK